jgi:hypothetical protein
LEVKEETPMRKLTFILALLLLSAAPEAFAARQRLAKTTFTPPPEPGVIFVVIDYARAGGLAQGTVVNVDWGRASRRVTVAAPYHGTCSETTPAGFVLKLRHPTSDSVPMTLTTTGTIVREPYQGDPPLELLDPCYKLQ